MKKTTSKNKEAKKICGLRSTKGTPFDLPCELDYCCPICHPKIRQFDETLSFSEYDFFMYCPDCNIDIPSMLCLKADTKKAVEIYTERFLGIIKQVKVQTAERIFDKIEKKMTFNTYLGDTFAKLTMREEDWKKLKEE